jgi:hypothetical protein
MNRGIVHENYIPDAYKYQTQNRLYVEFRRHIFHQHIHWHCWVYMTQDEDKQTQKHNTTQNNTEK